MRIAANVPSCSGRDGVVVEGQLDVGEPVVGQPQVGHLADRSPADLDEVAADELPRVGEARDDAVAALPAEQHHRDDHDGQQQARERERATRRRRHQPPIGLRGLLPQNICVPSSPMTCTPMMLATIDLAVARPTPAGPPVTW